MRVYAQFKGYVTRLSYDPNAKRFTSQTIENALIAPMQKRTRVKKKHQRQSEMKIISFGFKELKTVVSGNISTETSKPM
jgi:hypothetical protein